MDWKKFLSREFLVSLALMVVASVALFTMDKVSFRDWTWACGIFVGIFVGGLTTQKIKGATGGR